MTVSAWFAIAVGLLMLGWWAVELRAGVLRRADRAPAEIGLHITAELLAAGLLVVAGGVVLTGGGPELLLVALGMLLYTVIQSPGYFLARREAGPAAMFGVLTVLTVAALVAVA